MILQLPNRNSEFIRPKYPILKELRDNERHYTYLSRDHLGRSVVVKVAKNPKTAVILRSEMARIGSEEGRHISGPKIVDWGKDFFVTLKYDRSVSSMVDGYERTGNQRALQDLFREVLNGTFEISHEVTSPDSIKIAKDKARSRAVKYSSSVVRHSVLRKVNRILGVKDPDERNLPDIPIFLIVNSCIDLLRYQPDGRSTVTNHSCLHLEHLYEGIRDTDALVAIDWEHSELQPYRYEFLDEAYIFQNLLQKHSEASAALFYNTFIQGHLSVLESEQKKIRTVFMKKLLGGLFEMLNDPVSNPDPGIQIGLHVKYLKFFSQCPDISGLGPIRGRSESQTISSLASDEEKSIR